MREIKYVEEMLLTEKYHYACYFIEVLHMLPWLFIAFYGYVAFIRNMVIFCFTRKGVIPMF